MPEETGTYPNMPEREVRAWTSPRWYIIAIYRILFCLSQLFLFQYQMQPNDVIVYFIRHDSDESSPRGNHVIMTSCLDGLIDGGGGPRADHIIISHSYLYYEYVLLGQTMVDSCYIYSKVLPKDVTVQRSLWARTIHSYTTIIKFIMSSISN